MSLPPRVRSIIAEAAARQKVSAREIAAAGRRAPVSRARQEAMWRLRQMRLANGRPPSYPQIGAWLKRHHATVIHGVAAHQARMMGA